MPTSTSLQPCPNCHEPLRGRYCSECGQDCGNLGLSARTILAEGVRQLSGWDSALLKTMRGLWKDPGGLAADYVNGRRKQYLNPARFCFVALGLWFVALKVLGVDVLDSLGVHASVDGAEAKAVAEQVREFVRRHLDWFLFLALPARSFFFARAFRTSGRSVPACLVLVLYVAGFGFLVGILLAGLEASGLQGAQGFRPLIGLLWSIRATRAFFGASWRAAILKTVLVSLLHMLSTVLLVALVAVPWVMLR